MWHGCIERLQDAGPARAIQHGMVTVVGMVARAATHAKGHEEEGFYQPGIRHRLRPGRLAGRADGIRPVRRSPVAEVC